jgi:hypothetical protein
MSIRWIRGHARRRPPELSPQLEWRKRGGYAPWRTSGYVGTPVEEIRDIGIRIQKDWHIPLKGCVTPDEIRDKLDSVVKSHNKAIKVTEEKAGRNRLRSKIRHLKALRDSNFPERLSNFIWAHPKDILYESMLFGYKTAKEMRLVKTKTEFFLRGRMESAKKRYERFHHGGR